MSPTVTSTPVPDFRKVRGPADLPLHLGCKAELSRRLLTAPNKDLFQIHHIPKKGKKGTREIWEVRRPYAEIYKALSQRLQTFLRSAVPDYPHPASHGYLAGRSILSNARTHVGVRQLICADIRDFFRSITETRVRDFLISLGIRPDGAAALTSIVVRDDHLPLGLHTSPPLANAICHSLDYRLAALVPAGRYTRYADDLTFSGPTLPTRDEVAQELAKDGFLLADDKWRLERRGHGLYVTGLSIEDGRAPHVPRAMKRRIRQELYYAEQVGLQRHIARRGYASVQSGINKIDGTIQFIRGIERTLGNSLQSRWTSILRAAHVSSNFASVGAGEAREVLFVIDESVIRGPHGGMLCLGLVTIEDPQLIRNDLTEFLADQKARPTPSTPDDLLESDGLHWNTLTPDDRSRATDRIRDLPFRAFIAYCALPTEDRNTYSAAYVRLLRHLLKNRLLKYDHATVTVLAEENSKVRGDILQEVVRDCYEALDVAESRRPAKCPGCSVVRKQADAALPVSDLVLGIFGEYARVEIGRTAAGRPTKTMPGAQATERFAKVQEKIRVIFDLESKIVYSRRRPFMPWKSEELPAA